MASSPTSRTLKLLRDEGWQAQVVERWNPFAKVRQDLFGIIDVLAIRGCEMIGIQATSASNHAKRVAKARANDKLAAWLSCPCRKFEVWSWRKIKNRWQVRREVAR